MINDLSKVSNDFTEIPKQVVNEILLESPNLFPDDKPSLLPEPPYLMDEIPRISDSKTDNEELDIREGLDASLDATIDLDLELLSSQIIETNATDNLSGLREPLMGEEDILTGNTTASLGGLYDDPIEYGTPFTDGNYWRQQAGDFSCAVVAQISVYESLTGNYLTEDVASTYAQQQGWFDPTSGTPLAYSGNILETLGIETYQLQNATLNDLADSLARGDKPIVGLDGSEIWNPMYDSHGNPLDQTNAGHAVWVTGIDIETDGSVGIIVNDSGHSNGMTSVIDKYDFLNAWQDYGNFVTIADNPYA